MCRRLSRVARRIEGRCRIKDLMDIPRGADEAVHEDVCSIFCCEFRSGDNEHVCPPAEAICEEEDVRISSGRGWQGSKIVNADGYSRAIRQGDGESRPTNDLTGRFPGLTFEAASYPPFGADFHTYPPIETFQHFEYCCDTKVARSLGVTCVHDLWSG